MLPSARISSVAINSARLGRFGDRRRFWQQLQQVDRERFGGKIRRSGHALFDVVLAALAKVYSTARAGECKMAWNGLKRAGAVLLLSAVSAGAADAENKCMEASYAVDTEG